MNNTTLPQESGTALDSPGFMVYSILLTVIVLAAGVVMGITVAALTKARSIPRPLRVFLINLLLSGLVVVLVSVFIAVTSAVLVVLGSEHPRPPLYLCRLYVWLFGVGSVARPGSFAAFSLSVLAIVRFGKKTISLHCAAGIITILWLGPIAVCFYILIPYVYGVQFVNGIACFPDNNNISNIPASGTLFAVWVTAGGLIPMTISIAVPIICLCYINKNAVTEITQYWKGLSKFSLFLVLGGVINIAGQIIPAVAAHYTESPRVYLTYTVASVSFLSTPIIIIAYFKLVQEQVREIVTCGKLPKQAKDSKCTSSTPGSIETE